MISSFTLGACGVNEQPRNTCEWPIHKSKNQSHTFMEVERTLWVWWYKVAHEWLICYEQIICFVFTTSYWMINIRQCKLIWLMIQCCCKSDFLLEKFKDVEYILEIILGLICLLKIRSKDFLKCRKYRNKLLLNSALQCANVVAVRGCFQGLFGAGKIVQGCQNIPITVGDVLGQTGVDSDTQKTSVLGVKVACANLSRFAICGNFRGWNLLDLKCSGAVL